MNWRSIASVLIAFVAASITIWLSPLFLDRIGLGEFVFVGHVCLTLLVLSVLEIVFARIWPGQV